MLRNVYVTVTLTVNGNCYAINAKCNAMKKQCIQCGTYFEPKRKTAKYCSNSCRTMAHRKRHDLPEPEFLKPKQKTLSGVGDAESTALVPVRTVKTVQGTLEKLKEGEYLKTITENVKVKRTNPTYLSKEMEIQKVEDRMTILENEKNRLIKRYTGILNNYPDLKSTLGGAALGSSLAAITDKGKTKDVGRILWFGLLGGAIGYATHQITKPTEQQKAKELQNIRLKVDQINDELMGQNIELYALKWDLNTIQKNIIGVEQRSRQIVAKREETLHPLNLGELGGKEAIKIKPIDEVGKSKDMAIPLAEFQKKEFKTLGFKGEWRKLGDPGLGFRMLIWGKDGNGKSTYALRFAEYLANNHGYVLYNSSEEEHGLSIHNKTKEIKSEFFELGRARSCEELRDLLKDPKYVMIFIDSINDMNMTFEQFKTISDENPNRCFVFIMQATKEGEFRGGNKFAHLARIRVQIVNRQPIIKKSNYGGDVSPL